MTLAMTPNCAGTDTDTWFSLDPDDVDYCRRICATCPVRAACLVEAEARDEQYGIWGGRLFEPRWVTACVTNHITSGWVVRGSTVDGDRLIRYGFRSRADAERHRDELLERIGA